MNRRVHEIARELGIEPSEIVEFLKNIGEYAKSASSGVTEPVVRRIYDAYNTKTTMPDRPESRDRFPVTPPTTLTWQANPVKEPTRPEIIKQVAKLGDVFPESRGHRTRLQALGSQFVHASLLPTQDGRQSGYALARFSGAIEAAFGLTREVLFFYSPYHDLQIRSFTLAKKKLAELEREVTPDIIFFSAPDERITIKLKDWSKPQFTAIPLPLSLGEEPIALIAQLRDNIYARDLFYETTPVSGDTFFGRKTLLQELRDDVANQRASGLFGLRKSGKTSILLQLAETLKSDQLALVFVDLETLPSPPVDPTPDFIREVAGRVSAELSKRKFGVKELTAVAAAPSVTSFKIALDDAVRRLANRHVTLVLLLDEIEFLTPSDQVDTQEGAYPGVAQVLASMRAVAQSTNNFTFILSGLTNHILENGRLYGRPNPMFSWAKARYVGPFSRKEADELATSIGSRMGIEIQESALTALYDASGGHAYLYRNLASEVVKTLPMETYRRVVKNPDVLRQLIPWKRSVAGNVEAMLDHLARYYPTESILLEALRESPDDFAEISRGEDRAIHHLVNLGLIREKDNKFEISVLLELN